MTLKLNTLVVAIAATIFLANSASAQCFAELDCLEQLVFECGSNTDPLVTGYPEVSGECPDAVLSFSDASEGDECLSTITRTWYLMLGEEILDSCNQIIILEDTTPPGFGELPEFLAVPCGEDLPEPPACPAVDNCSGVALCEGFSAQTGLAMDSCTLSISNGIGPDWSIWLPNIPAPSPWFIWENEGTMVTYFDGSAYISGVVRNDTDPNLAFEVSIWLNNSRSWDEWSALGRNYKDDLNLAGNNYQDWMYYEMVGGFSRLTGIDGLEGSLLLLSHLPANYYFGFQCGIAANNHNANNGISGWFNFSGNYNGYQVEGDGDLSADKACTAVEANECASNAGYTYFWRAVDGCGNESFAFQSVASIDVTAPIFIEFPEDVTVNCSDLPFEVEVPVATDNCPGGVILDGPFDAITDAECPVAYNIQRTWIATDACGNATTRSQFISVIDDSLPYFAETPEIIELECAPGDEALVEAFDDCSEVTLSFIDIPTEGCEGSAIRNYTAEDACGNTATLSVQIVVTDNIAPQFTLFPEDIQVSCGNIPPAESAIIQYSDNCTNLNLSVEENLIDGDCDYNYTLERTYTISDACGNSSSQIWTIQVVDEMAPIIYGMPDDALLSCGDQVPDAIVSAYDNCDPFPNVALTAITIQLECGYQLIRTWTASDVCGNETSQMQTVTVSDIDGPVFDPIDTQISLSCTDPIPEPEASATDECTEFTIEVSEFSIAGNCPESYTIFRTYTATDGCGNSTVFEQEISISDNEAPIFENVLEEITVNCDDFEEIPVPIVSDNCSEVNISHSDVPGNEACVSGLSRTWIATDACGNQSTFIQQIFIVDTTAPVFTEFPEDATFSCEDILNIGDEVISYNDNCSNVELSIEESTLPGECEDTYTLTRTYTITDACGNSNSADWIISVVDNTPPFLFGVPDDVTLSCTEEATDAVVLAFDNCDDFVDISLSAVTVSLDCGYLFTRTWTATDDCGNETSQAQIITFSDMEGPVFDPIDTQISLSCTDAIPEPEASATDECTEFTIEISEFSSPGDCPASYTIFRTYTATDGCGNSTVIEQVISISDNEAPIFEDVLEEITVNCDDFEEIPVPIVSDNCSEVNISYNDVPGEEACVSGLNRTWVATDACGNQSTFNQQIFIVDTTAPVFTEFPEDATVSCNGILPVGDELISYNDNCSNVELSIEESFFPGECEDAYTIIRSYTITDVCGNSTSAEWIISVVDITPPSLFGVPDDITLSCTEEASDAVVLAFDACDDFVDISLSAVTEPLDCGYLFTRTWTAVDNCGNTTVATQVVTFIDDTDPYLSYLPENIFLNCGDPVPPVADVVALDECDPEPVLVVTEIMEGSPDDCPYYIVRIFRAFDCNGNQVIYAQYIYFNQEPGVVGMPEADRQEMQMFGLIGDPGSNDYQVGITSGDGGRYQLDLLDLNGRVVVLLSEGDFDEAELYTLPVNIEGITSGIYLLRLRSAAGEDIIRIPVLR